MKKCEMYGIVWLILADLPEKSCIGCVGSGLCFFFLLQMFHPQIGCHFICIVASQVENSLFSPETRLAKKDVTLLVRSDG